MTPLALLEPHPRGNARPDSGITTHGVLFWEISFGAHPVCRIYMGVSDVKAPCGLRKCLVALARFGRIGFELAQKTTGSVSGIFSTSCDTVSKRNLGLQLGLLLHTKSGIGLP